MRTKLLALLLLALPMAAFAQNTPVGHWVTIDDKTQKPKSVVEIYEAKDGSLAGRVTKVLQSERGPNPVCDKCSGERKNKPVEGMVILWSVRKHGDTWEDGKILDPASGKIYSVKVTPMEGGKKLDVRGFMGFSLLGRTQTWVRQ
ncbi:MULTISPECIES: DUF2147 domain-containing protein [unclassified Lysobacter]|uniref:DUF2147 domain-containing protein n=1 Tax=unclassified Lysobacter TaxID=2635362 RepID=UPI0006F712BE|nr:MULTISPECIES: DUF2147 domain-containing protein [unclassified Lysobacter]KRA21047.1 hypothetical protein ASD69_07090 [Lysobacter sp. Root604]KRD40050.1 hypothetical protein ASE35_07025 [Lysobacter sp. Root916]KRD80079.1 hypothetical protein ASE43_04135 [Lysobacter sp. Root983]